MTHFQEKQQERLLKEMKTQDVSVFEKINHIMNRLTSTELRIVRVLLANYPMNGLETIANLADKSGASSPSVLRFARKLGFKGYTEFQATLRSELKTRLSSPLRKNVEDIEIERESLEYVMPRFSDAFCNNLSLSMEYISIQDLLAIHDLLSEHQLSFYLLGGRLTDSVAHYFYTHLHAVRPNVRHIPADRGVWPEYLLDIKENDVLCVFDIRSYQHDVQDFANKASKRKAEIVLFTDQWLSPISNISQHVFPMRTNIPSRWDSVVSIIALLEVIVAIYTQEKWSDDIKMRISKLKKLGSFI